MSVVVDRNNGTVMIDIRMAECILNALLIAGYSEEHVDQLEAFVGAVGSTPELDEMLKSALASLSQKRIEKSLSPRIPQRVH